MIKSAVIVDTRNDISLIDIINNHMKHLDSEWKLTIFCGLRNSHFLKKAFSEAKIISLGSDRITIDQYNALLTSEYFWKQIEGEKVLIFQADSMLLRKGIDDFLQYDYVGAPWMFQENGGNGGLSLRTKQAMLDIIKIKPFVPHKDGNEDIYFCNNMHIVSNNMAPREVCFKFSVETIYHLGTLGYHSISRYHSPEKCNQIINQYDDKIDT
jgi:hypothetical protein